jgi:hypothetical protein
LLPFHWITEAATKFEPFTASVNEGPPIFAPTGESALMLGAGIGVGVGVGVGVGGGVACEDPPHPLMLELMQAISRIDVAKRDAC